MTTQQVEKGSALVGAINNIDDLLFKAGNLKEKEIQIVDPRKKNPDGTIQTYRWLCAIENDGFEKILFKGVKPGSFNRFINEYLGELTDRKKQLESELAQL